MPGGRPLTLTCYDHARRATEFIVGDWFIPIYTKVLEGIKVMLQGCSPTVGVPWLCHVLLICETQGQHCYSISDGGLVEDVVEYHDWGLKHDLS